MPTALKPVAEEDNLSLLDRLALIGDDVDVMRHLRSMAGEESIETVVNSWKFQRRPSQDARYDEKWRYRVWLGGRGSGKTLSGSGAVDEAVYERDVKRLVFVGRTSADIRRVMVDGATGILNFGPEERRPLWKGAPINRVIWPKTGAIAECLSADEPKQGAGPNSALTWCDEMAQYPFVVNQEGAMVNMWDQAKLFTREGDDPRILVTTTPRPVKALRDLVANPTALVTVETTYANRSNLPESFIHDVMEMEGTRIGRQEIYAEILDDIEDALWTSQMIDDNRIMNEDIDDLLGKMERVVVGVDPDAVHKEGTSYTGITVVGLREGHAYVFDSIRLRAHSMDWAIAVRRMYDRWQADTVVVEINHGGDLVTENLRVNGGLHMPVKGIRAKRGKELRAEPVATAYKKGLVHHVGQFHSLENEMMMFPLFHEFDDEIDSLVYAVNEILVQENPVVRFWFFNNGNLMGEGY